MNNNFSAYGLLVKIIVSAAILELGLTLTDIGECKDRLCMDALQRASRKVLKIDWKPISVFPEEGRKFNR
jgi:hypothetical protein